MMFPNNRETKPANIKLDGFIVIEKCEEREMVCNTFILIFSLSEINCCMAFFFT